MTFAEFVLLIAAGLLIYLMLRPLQRSLESKFTRYFRGKRPSPKKPVIDITDYSKKKD